MRISHADLETCVKNPRQWYVSTINAEKHGYPMGYERVLRLSLAHFHKTSAGEARDYLNAMIKKHDFKNATRVTEIEVKLDSYINWSTGDKAKVAGTEVKISLPLGFLELRGQIGRVDVTDTGYRAILYGATLPNWQTQLRLPLIQIAVASIYGRPAEKIAVGFQELDGSALHTAVFSQGQIAAAENRFRALGSILRRLSTPRNKP
jgi:hypothetical protein